MKAGGDAEGAHDVATLIEHVQDHILVFATASWIKDAPVLVVGLEADLHDLEPGETLGGQDFDLALKPTHPPHSPFSGSSPLSLCESPVGNSISSATADMPSPTHPPLERPHPDARVVTPPASGKEDLSASLHHFSESALANSITSAPAGQRSPTHLEPRPLKRRRANFEIVVPPVDLKRLNGTRASSSSDPVSAAADAEEVGAHALKFTLHEVDETTRLALLDSGEALESEQPSDWGIVRRCYYFYPSFADRNPFP